MNTSSELFQRAQKVIPGGVHSPVRSFQSVGMEPLFFQSAEGAYLTSVDGKRFIDFCQSFGPNILGHRDPDVQAEVETAVSEAWSFGACDPYSLEMAEWVCKELPHVDKMRLVCSGTEAVMSALRIARAATGRAKVVKFNGCYHGHADGMLVKAGSGLAGQACSDSAGVSNFVSGETLVCELNDEDQLDQVFAQHSDQIAAVIVEPLPANFGLLLQRREFIEHIYKKARECGALVIFDEVISGFRVAMGGMAERLQMEPDLVTYGKVIGGGFPVGAYAGKAKYMDLVAPLGPVYQAGTLAANPIAVRAGLSTLKKLKQEKVIETLERRANAFTSQLNESFRNEDLPLQVTQFGSLFWFHPNVGGETMRSPSQFTSHQKELFNKFFAASLEQGVYLAPSAFEVGFISYAHTESILAEAAEAMLKAARSVYV